MRKLQESTLDLTEEMVKYMLSNKELIHYMWVVNLVQKCNLRITLANNVNEITHWMDALREVNLVVWSFLEPKQNHGSCQLVYGRREPRDHVHQGYHPNCQGNWKQNERRIRLKARYEKIQLRSAQWDSLQVFIN